ncbi:MAG: 3-oxoacyl-ACP synthase, partial [Glaciimonas sp.]|nr:3-oxoacyl-ACP synthase [Glaciimonas sp.]
MTIYSKIIGTGSYLPPKRVSNDELAIQLAAKGIETSDEWISSRSGIKVRHFVDAGVHSSDLAVEAAKHALQAAKMQASDVDLIIVATSTPDHLGGFPSTACVVQRKLGITTGGAAFDVQAVCSGF